MPALVSVHALTGGHLTIAEKLIVEPAEASASRKVPSLSFLVQHTDAENHVTRIVFDLGIRKVLQDYSPLLYKKCMEWQPVSGQPDTVQNLAAGGLRPSDIDFIIFSHMHWDHVGTPSDYPESTYVVGPGSLSLLDGTGPTLHGSHHCFEPDLLDRQRTIELHAPGTEPQHKRADNLFSRPWVRKGPFEFVMDIFGDESVFVVSAPGHIPGHINLICRLASGNHVYLAGDACHDRRLLTGERGIATWTDPSIPGVMRCMHYDKETAEKTIAAIREAMRNPGELCHLHVILAHDWQWQADAKDTSFFPGFL